MSRWLGALALLCALPAWAGDPRANAADAQEDLPAPSFVADDDALPQLARRRRKPRKKKPAAAAPAPAPAQDPAAAPEPAPAPAASEGGAPAPLRQNGPSRVEFDDRLIQGQTNKANAIYLFERRASELRTLVKKRRDYHREIDETQP